MTVESVLFSLVLTVIVAGVGWTVTQVTRIRSNSDTMVKILESPEKNGIGTDGMGPALAELSTAIKQMTHYMLWFVKQSTGKEPPPPTPGG